MANMPLSTIKKAPFSYYIISYNNTYIQKKTCVNAESVKAEIGLLVRVLNYEITYRIIGQEFP